jgi:hypothetical protein
MSFAQNGSSSVEDDEFNLFLFTLVFVFISGVAGAAIIGAMAAALLLFFIFSLISLGAISTSIGIGLYKRSYEAGFKTFFVIVFGISCGMVGAIGLPMVNMIFNMPVTAPVAVLIGSITGILGGYIMAVSTFRLFQMFIRFLYKRLNAV